MLIITAASFSFLTLFLLSFILFFVLYLGMTDKKIYLAFSLMSFSIGLSLISFRILSIFIQEKIINNIAGSIAALILACSIIFFADTVYDKIKKFRKILVLSFSLLVLINIVLNIFYVYNNSINYYKTSRILMLLYAVFFIILLINAIINESKKKYETTEKEIKEKNEKRIIGTAFVIFFASIIIGIILSFIFTDYYKNFFQNILLFPYSSFLILVYVLAYMLIDSIIKEHKTLKQKEGQLEEINKTLEQKVADRTRELEQAKAEIEQKEKQKTDFFTIITHEIKTPLTLIGNYAEKQAREYGATENTGFILQNVYKLKRDINNYHYLQKIEQSQFLFNPDLICNISSLIKNFLISFKEITVKKEIQLTDDIKDNLYCRIDPAAADKIICNLLDNAVKYTPIGGKIEVGLKQKNRQIELTVRDNGIGIPEDELNHIYRPYYQTSHIKRNVQGIGMGLNIVNTIAGQYKLRIEVESEVNKGTIFTVCLPEHELQPGEKGAEPVDYTQPAEYIPIELKEEAYREGTPLLMFIEDNLSLLAYLQGSFRERYNIFFAVNGREALTKLAMMKVKPDVIISDIMMDGMDGYAFYDELQKNTSYHEIPFIFLTAKTGENERIKGLSRGAVDFIDKPFSLEELSAKISALIKIKTALMQKRTDEIGVMLFEYLNRTGIILPTAGQLSREEKLLKIKKEYRISDRELKVLSLLEQNYEYKEIAGILKISINTAQTYRKRLFEKCGVGSKKELMEILRQKRMYL